ATTKLLDVLLTDTQKAAIDDVTLRLWNWLDSRKRIRLRQHMMSPPFRMVLFGTMSSSSFFILNYMADDYPTKHGVSFLNSLAIITLLTLMLIFINEFFWPRIAKISNKVLFVTLSMVPLLAYAVVLFLGAVYLDYCCVAVPTFMVLHDPWHKLSVAILVFFGE